MKTMKALGGGAMALLPWLALTLSVIGAAPAAEAARPNLVIGMTLEPPGLDPTAGAAAAIAEIVQYNVFETLTKIGPDGKVTPLLAQSWEASPDQKTWTFRLRQDAKFQNGEPFNAAAVKFSFERAASDKSSNKDRRLFALMKLATPDPWTVVIGLGSIEPELLFELGQATAVIVEPKSAATNATAPVGTGPYQLDAWAKGSSLSLKAWPGWRNAVSARIIPRVSFRFIGEPAAQVAALLSGDVDAFPRVAVARSLAQFKTDRRFQVLSNPSRAKTILAINNKRKPLDDVRVRQAIAAAIDRKAVIEAAADGFGVPIGSHYVPGAPGYVDTTAINAYDPERAKTLLKEASYALNFPRALPLTLKLPPTPYARQSGELIAAELGKAGFQVKIENIEWAQWMSGVYTNHNYDLTLISHVEPLDLGNYAKPGYYWGYESAEFNKLYTQIMNTPADDERAKLLGEAQRLLARDSVNVFLYQPLWITVANKSLKGLWVDMPIFVNDLAALHWE